MGAGPGGQAAKDGIAMLGNEGMGRSAKERYYKFTLKEGHVTIKNV
jgi:hypothetical protein